MRHLNGIATHTTKDESSGRKLAHTVNSPSRQPPWPGFEHQRSAFARTHALAIGAEVAGSGAAISICLNLPNVRKGQGTTIPTASVCGGAGSVRAERLAPIDLDGAARAGAIRAYALRLSVRFDSMEPGSTPDVGRFGVRATPQRQGSLQQMMWIATDVRSCVWEWLHRLSGSLAAGHRRHAVIPAEPRSWLFPGSRGGARSADAPGCRGQRKQYPSCRDSDSRK